MIQMAAGEAGATRGLGTRGGLIADRRPRGPKLAMAASGLLTFRPAPCTVGFDI
jgi:hypothetical protein